ncbi:ImmA/IrrE family metallo-endopeptidase [Pantoea ananatis]|uniref:ImmA/IrrE family metallo-endopeptidase n=1 Tax=Pantoea ananas TaxID=553 RepID=UPI001B30D942|nr:ImmA/IrrE family metallo-endopeptidase [Pantoea ananatis]
MYQLRGPRVRPLKTDEITKVAINACLVLKFLSPHSYKNKKFRYDLAFESLTNYGIVINPIDDKEWFEHTYDLTEGHCDPQQRLINIPNKIFMQACRGEHHGLMVVFHELGHLLLQHKALLHYSAKEPNQEEDSEWQADLFADVMLRKLGFDPEYCQLAFNFD